MISSGSPRARNVDAIGSFGSSKSMAGGAHGFGKAWPPPASTSTTRSPARTRNAPNVLSISPSSRKIPCWSSHFGEPGSGSGLVACSFARMRPSSTGSISMRPIFIARCPCSTRLWGTDADDEQADAVGTRTPRVVDTGRHEMVSGLHLVGSVLQHELGAPLLHEHEVDRVRVVHRRRARLGLVRGARLVLDDHPADVPGRQLHVDGVGERGRTRR